MSLDIYLEGPEFESKCTCPRCDAVHTCTEREEYFEANITHNLTSMADEAGIYGIVWRPEENGIAKAEQMIEPLREGIWRMKTYPERFLPLNPSNGWGSYADFVPWLEKLLAACEQYPDATPRASR